VQTKINAQPRSSGDGADPVGQWWTKVLAGQTDAPHPVYAETLRVKLHGGVLRLSGEVASDQQRQSIIGEARRYIGRGLDDVDARRLVVKRPDGVRGVLDQTIIAAFPNSDVAERALTVLREDSRLNLKEAHVLKSDRDRVLDRIGEFVKDVRNALAAGHGVLIVRVDEIDAFEARELLDEDMRSLWTHVMPPVPSRGR
jgi:hypothetical protein